MVKTHDLAFQGDGSASALPGGVALENHSRSLGVYDKTYSAACRLFKPVHTILTTGTVISSLQEQWFQYNDIAY
jgi:hypothetical protein